MDKSRYIIHEPSFYLPERKPTISERLNDINRTIDVIRRTNEKNITLLVPTLIVMGFMFSFISIALKTIKVNTKLISGCSSAR